ncbi:MAG: gliding motility-associated C-terminal domain-containing protein [Bacteroidota bacterium]
MPYFKSFIWSLLCYLSCPQLSGQQFLNGSFEAPGTDCRPELSNGGFDTYVDHVYGMGNMIRAVGLLTSDCGLGAAQDGDYFVVARISGRIQERGIIGLEMTQPMIEGQSYTVEFYYKANNRRPKRNTIDIGLSNSNGIDDFGISVHRLQVEDGGWIKASIQFIAPLTGKYLTIKLRLANVGRVFFDNFSIKCPTELNLGSDTSYCYVKNILLRPGGNFTEYYWQDRSEGPEYIVNSPGLYWVEAQRDNCILRDSIYISEINRNCECQFYVPNAFSPNRDGVNDFILPMTDCELSVFDFQVYDRWGQMVFRSQDRNEGWDGRFRDQLMPRDTYVYQLIYQFSYQEENQVEQGAFLLFD